MRKETRTLDCPVFVDQGILFKKEGIHMKRIVTLLLAAGLVLGAAAGSQAADIKAKGNWTFSWQLGDNTCSKRTATSLPPNSVCVQIDVIASESLKAFCSSKWATRTGVELTRALPSVPTARSSRSVTATLTG